jgi:hypothetical protein
MPNGQPSQIANLKRPWRPGESADSKRSDDRSEIETFEIALPRGGNDNDGA